jgi:hypothetical protein
MIVPFPFSHSPNGQSRALRIRVNKDHQARLSLLVDEERALAKAIRCGPYAALGIQILWSTLFEELVGGGEFAGGELLTSAGCHYDAQSASSPSTNQFTISCG